MIIPLSELFHAIHLQLMLSNASGLSDYNYYFFCLPLTLRESRRQVSVSKKPDKLLI